MKMQNKKRGFTIVELVIVIAVIGILATVMIPTFTGIINRANQSAAQQQATAAYKMVLSEDDNAMIEDGYVFVVTKGETDYCYVLTGGKLVVGTVPADLATAYDEVALESGDTLPCKVYAPKA